MKSFIKCPPSKKKSTVFTLKNVDVDKVKRRFLSNIQGINYEDTQIMENKIIPETKEDVCMTTSVNKIIEIEEKRPRVISFYDSSKQQQKWVVAMSDYITTKNLPNKSSVCCFWCKHTFETSPLGCPIQKFSKKVKTLFRNCMNNKDIQRFREVTSCEAQEMEEDDTYSFKNMNNEQKLTLIPTIKYLTDGIFCSFNCVLAFIRDNKHKSLYVDSEFLLMEMYKDCLGEIPDEMIIPAPSWRLLKTFGGHMDINKFRNSFKCAIFTDTLNIFLPIAPIFSEELIF